MKKVWIKRTIVIMTIIGIISCILALKHYRAPVHKYATETLCSLDGNQIEVVIDVTCYQYLFQPTEVKGLIAIDGKVYRNVSIKDNKTFNQLLEEKQRKDSLFLFAAWPHDGHWITADQIRLEYVDSVSDAKDFELICVSVYPYRPEGGSADIYYGPAETKEEAMEVLEKFMNR